MYYLLDRKYIRQAGMPIKVHILELAKILTRWADSFVVGGVYYSNHRGPEFNPNDCLEDKLSGSIEQREQNLTQAFNMLNSYLEDTHETFLIELFATGDKKIKLFEYDQDPSDCVANLSDDQYNTLCEELKKRGLPNNFLQGQP